MEVPGADPRVALVVGVAAGVVSPPFRRIIGRGVGYAARAVIVAGSPVAGAGRDIYDSAREVARRDGRAKTSKQSATAA